MKPTLLIGLALFLLFGCGRQEPAQMTSQEQDVAKKEISEVLNQQLQTASKLDAEALLQSYSNSPDFILLTTTGSMADYQGTKNGTAEMYKSLTALEFTTLKNEFRFLPGNIVICAWLGKCDITFKTEERATIDSYAITFVFKKLDNHWKIIYSHESASPPVEETPTK
jgi:ketosteroid isomerase-like protein